MGVLRVGRTAELPECGIVIAENLLGVSLAPLALGIVSSVLSVRSLLNVSDTRGLS